MYAQCEIKQERFICWSDQLIKNVNTHNGGWTLLRVGVRGKGRRAIER